MKSTTSNVRTDEEDVSGVVCMNEIDLKEDAEKNDLEEEENCDIIVKMQGPVTGVLLAATGILTKHSGGISLWPPPKLSPIPDEAAAAVSAPIRRVAWQHKSAAFMEAAEIIKGK